MEQVRGYFESEGGSHFDPHLTALLLENFADFVAIYEEFPD